MGGAAIQRIASVNKVLKGATCQEISIRCVMVSKHTELLGVNEGVNSFLACVVLLQTEYITCLKHHLSDVRLEL